MNESDELYRKGISHYATALFAAGHFESVVIEVASRVMDYNKLDHVAKIFAVERLHGGGILRTRPSVEDMHNMPLPGFGPG